MRRLFPLLVFPLSVGMAFLGGACGGDEASPAEILAAAPAKTVDETSKLSIDVSSNGTPPINFKGQGAFDYKAQRGRMSIDMSALGLPTGARGGTAEMVMVGDVIYMKLPVDPAELGGRPWVKVDVAAAARQAGVDAQRVRQQFQSNDPTNSLNALRGVSDDVKAVGTEEVRGTETTHYTATVDLNKASQQSPPEVREALDQLREQLGTPTFPVDAWIDSDGRLRRQRFSIDLSKIRAPGVASGTVSGVMTTTVELFDFGTEVDASEPPPDQVSDLMSLLQQGARR